ncbi:MAG: OmpA family protein, partial [Kofleriaceae bacterium]
EIRRPAGHPEVASTANLSDEELSMIAQQEGKEETITITGSTSDRDSFSASGRSSVGDILQALPRSSSSSSPAVQAPPPRKAADPRVVAGDLKVKQLSQQLMHSNQTIVVEGYAQAAGGDADRRANDRANIVRNQLIDQGVAPARIKIVTKVDASQPERVRLVAQAAGAEDGKPAGGKAGKRGDGDAQPVGESHFANPLPMTVDKGSSAMISMVRSQTPGEVVYLYDSESERGNARFAFRAVRFKNPTDSTLETGPVTVYGQERFIGEGLTEPIPPRESAVVPYALDRQIVIDRNDGEDDQISRLTSLQRGILTAEVQHVRRQRLTITNRLNQVAKVFLRHTVNKGWKLIEQPSPAETVGEASLFVVELAPHEVRPVTIAEATPIERTLDLSADITLEMMKVWVEAPQGTPELKDQLRKLLAVHRSLVDLAQAQDSMRRRLVDYRGRMDELHGQIFSLQAVKTGGDLMGHLKTKMKEISDRVQKTTIQIVDQEEKIMLAKVQFQDTLAELSLPDATSPGKPGAMPALSSVKPPAARR